MREIYLTTRQNLFWMTTLNFEHLILKFPKFRQVGKDGYPLHLIFRHSCIKNQRVPLFTSSLIHFDMGVISFLSREEDDGLGYNSIDIFFVPESGPKPCPSHVWNWETGSTAERRWLLWAFLAKLISVSSEIQELLAKPPSPTQA